MYNFYTRPLLPTHVANSPIGWYPVGEFFNAGNAFYVVVSVVSTYIAIYIYLYFKNMKTVNSIISKKTSKILIFSMIAMILSLVSIFLRIPNEYVQAFPPKLGVIIAIIPVYLFYKMLTENNFQGIVSTSFMFNIINKFSEGLLLTNQNHIITFANPAFTTLTGTSDVIGKKLTEVLPIDDLSTLEMEHAMELIVDNSFMQFNYSILRNKNNEVVGRFFLAQDITEIKASQFLLQEANKNLERRVQEATSSLIKTNEELKTEIENRIKMSAQIEKAARTDSLTGLNNRSYFKEQVNAILDETLLNKCSNGTHIDNMLLCHTLLYMDLNKFKYVNDTYGHIVGDEVLRIFSTKLKETFEPLGICGRIGGDEFIIFLRSLIDKNKIIELCDTLFASLDHCMQIEGENIVIAPSIGITYFPEDSKELLGMIKCADTAMYHAKTNKLKYAFYNEITCKTKETS